MNARSCLWLGLTLMAGCSSPSFDVAAADIGVDTQTADSDLPVDSAVDSGIADSTVDTEDTTPTPDSAPPVDSMRPDADSATMLMDTGTTPDTTVIDSGTVDSAMPDTFVVDTAPPTCSAVTSALTEIWVDATSPYFMPSGTSSCPFKTIQGAIGYVNTLPAAARTIRVRAGTYNETGAVVLKSQITLIGAGIGSTIIMGGGACMGIGSCIVRVEGGATLEQVTVDASPTAKHGIVTGATSGGSYPVLKNLKSTGAVGDGNAGILDSAGALIGPNVEASGNKLGLVVWGNQKTSVTGGGNVFDRNTLYGINHEGTGLFEFRGGGSVSTNAKDGMRFGEVTSDPPPTHEIYGVTIKDNGAAGMRFLDYATGIVHENTITGNKVGIIANHGPANSFDFGVSAFVGNNSFGSTTTKNTTAGVCIMKTRASGMRVIGNKWPACPATIKPMIEADVTCDTLPAYYDVWYTGMSEPDATGCTAG
jgi:hypothetical protein